METTYTWEKQNEKKIFGGEALLHIKDVAEDALESILQDKELGLSFQKEEAGKLIYFAAYTDDGMRIVVMHQDKPLHTEEAIDGARANYRWPEAVDAAEKHKSHIVVAVGPVDEEDEIDPKELAKVFVKTMAALSKWDAVLALRVCGVLEKPEAYRMLAEHAFTEGIFPLLNVVFVGVYSLDGAHVCGYTVGLEEFGHEEIEIAQSKKPAMEVVIFLYDIAGYLISSGATLKEGETIGLEEGQGFRITKSAGLSMTGETLKIHF